MAPIKLKLTTKPGRPDGESSPQTPQAATPSGSGGSGSKLKINASQPSTPASEHPASASANKKQPKRAADLAAQEQQSDGKARGKAGAGTKKRAANDDTISPAAKRAQSQSLSRKPSLILKSTAVAQAAQLAASSDPQAVPQSAKIKLKKKSAAPKLRTINVRRPPPPRLPGQGYDSEDSEAEDDPAIQQAFILRMQPGEDADYIREAISTGKIGLEVKDGGAEVSLIFLDKDNRRAIVKVRGRMYAAALVDLPCIVETMKSWDKKGWLKVADMSQMLLVLGRCTSEEEARTYALPREVNKENMQYAHGLTPPMKWVRKRRFRKRMSYKSIANVEEEVERLLREDEQVEAAGGEVTLEYLDREQLERSQEPHSQLDDDDESMADADGVLDSVENGQEEYYSEDEADAADLEGDLQAMFDADHAAMPDVQEMTTESPLPLTDQPVSMGAAENMMTSDSPAAMEAETPSAAVEDTTQDEQDSSDEDDDDDDDEEESSDEDSPDVMDEDAIAKAAERNQQLEEVADLEREVEAQKHKVENMKNQLLKERAIAQLRTLEEDLRVKRGVFGLDEDGDDGEEGGESEA